MSTYNRLSLIILVRKSVSTQNNSEMTAIPLRQKRKSSERFRHFLLALSHRQFYSPSSPLRQRYTNTAIPQFDDIFLDITVPTFVYQCG